MFTGGYGAGRRKAANDLRGCRDRRRSFVGAGAANGGYYPHPMGVPLALTRARKVAIVFGYVGVFWVALPAAIWFAASWGDTSLHRVQAPHGFGWLVVAAGTALLLWSWVTLWRDGGGLPISALPPPRFTSRGPYRYVRHPGYLGFNIGLLGVGIAVGSPTLTWIIAPAFLPLWIVYAALEERGLLRRFGQTYVRYQRRVGIFPRFPVYRIAQLAMSAGAMPVHVEGKEHIPRSGPAVLIANHACYVDFLYVGSGTRRRIRFVTTLEIYRKPLARWFMRRADAIPLGRYCHDFVATREILRSLQEGDLIGIFPEGERSTLGRLQAPLPAVAKLLGRLPYPIVPVGISGSYDVGPRWSDRIRRRPVRVRIGRPIDVSIGDPIESVAAALRELVDPDPQPVHLQGLPLDRLARALWACPRCHDEESWRAERFRCDVCGARWNPTSDGWFIDDTGQQCSLADIANPLWDQPEQSPPPALASGWLESPQLGSFEPLQPLATAELEVNSDALRFEDLVVPIEHIERVTTERADTLQVATLDRMWQFRPERASAFRYFVFLMHQLDRRPCKVSRERGSP